MHERRYIPPPKINDDLLAFVLKPPPTWFWRVAIVLGLIAGSGLVTIGIMAVYGLQILSYTTNENWSIPITTFVFLVGISHSGVMISAVLRLTHAEWRRPITRVAEVLTVFSLAVAALFPVIHTGRMWRTMYWSFPYDFTRNLWPSVRSALIWDATSLLTYLFATLLFVYVAMIPDLAVARDRSSGWQRRFYSLLALNFRGYARQWRLQGIAGILLAALLLPIFVSVHSTVASNFSMTLVPGWHSTLLGPYYVISAIHSGVAAVVTVCALARWLFRLHEYITPEHFDALGRLQIAVALGWVFLYFVEFYFGVYSRDAMELVVWELHFLTPPYSYMAGAYLLLALFIPFPFWLVPRFRRDIRLMFGLSLLVNVGMWIERYVLVVAPLSHKFPFPFTWTTELELTPFDYILVFASLAAVLLGVLLFAKFFPIVPLYDIKEGQVLKREVRIGRARTPAAVRE